MTYLEALILGIVEGLTEYLPVSSTGHLIVVSRFLGLEEGSALNAFNIAIQFGAIIAVLGVYGKHVIRMIKGLLGNSEYLKDRKLALLIITAFMPAAVLGTLFDDMIESYLFGLNPVIFAWFVGGVAILIVQLTQSKMNQAPHDSHDSHDSNDSNDPNAPQKQAGDSETQNETKPARGTLYDLTYSHALIIGFAQCIAMWPGTSRSLMTILAGWCIGLSLTAAVEFSFLLGVLTLSAATCYALVKNGDAMLTEIGLDTFLVGLIFAGLSAWIAVKGMISYLNKHGLAIFGWYRIAIALLVFGLLMTGHLPEEKKQPGPDTGNQQDERADAGNQSPVK